MTPVGAGTGVPGSRRMARLGSVRARASSNPFSTSSKATSPFAEKPSTRRKKPEKRLDDEEEDPIAILVEEEDRDAADEATLQPEKDECEMKMNERIGSIFTVAWTRVRDERSGEEKELACRNS